MTTTLTSQKVWKFPELTPALAELVKAAGGSEIVAKLLMRRGIDTAEKAESFLDPAKYKPTSPMVFADMPKAIVRISKAIASKEKITVYGDYDVDGVTGTSVLYTVLKKLGANVDFYIPNRANEGYGLNLKAVSVLASKHRTKLIISCDCGISNFSEINLAKSLGVETIIVDHHSMPEVLPPAVAILHPKQFSEEHPLFHLPGVGVAYKLCEALLLDNNMPDEIPKMHDFVTLGMIADMVPLVHENRYLVQIGLPALINSPRAGIKALLDNTVKMDGSDIVGFGLAPRINAVGRLSDANLAVKLMTVEDPAEAEQLANQLEMENTKRQELCEQIFFEADKKAKIALASGNDRALALYSHDWHHGVVGIVASRLVEKYHCPVFVAELDTEEGKIKGSARGIPGIDLYQVLKANEHLMTKWGGHQMAAGFSAESTNADVLCRAIVDTCNRMLEGQPVRAVLEIDLEIESKEVHLDMVRIVRQLGPFGMWNKKPTFVMKSLQVLNTRVLGKEGKHHRIVLKAANGDGPFECVYWRSAGRIPIEGQEIDLAFSADINVFNNTERLQLVLADWRAAGEVEEPESGTLDFSPPVETATTLPENFVVHVETQYDGKTASTSIKAIENLTDNVGTANSLGAPAASRLLNSNANNTNSNNSEIISFAPPDDSVSVMGPSEVLPVVTVAETIAARAISARAAKKANAAAASAEESKTEAMEPLESLDNSEEVFEENSSSPRSGLAKIDLPPLALDNESVDSVITAAITSAISSSPNRPSEPPETTSKTGDFQYIRQTGASVQISFKDLRGHSSPTGVVDAAVRKLQGKVQIFAEASKLAGHKLCDRTAVTEGSHLLIWQYPPSMQVFRTLIASCRPSQIYLCGAAEVEHVDAATFLKRLLSLIRFAVNQKDGQAQAEKLAAAMSTTKMALALGLTILKKLSVIDWYAEDSVLYMDILGQPSEGWELLPEFRQLSNSLREITEFRAWCSEAPLDEVQSELVPNAIRVADNRTDAPSQEASFKDSDLRVKYDERASHTSGQSRES